MATVVNPITPIAVAIAGLAGLASPAIVKDAIHYGCLTTNTKGKYVNTSTGFKYETGDEPKVIEMVMNPAHQEEMMNLLAEVTKKWNKF
jgi:hypothetical protein